MGNKVLDLFKLSWRNIYTNKYSYIMNTALLQVFMLTIGGVFLSTIFKGMLFVSGESNLTKDTFYSIITSPISLVLVFVFILMLSFLMFIEFSILTLNVYGNSVGKRYSLKVIIKNAFKKIKTLLGFQVIFFILYFITIIPLANLGMGSILTDDLFIPKFITGEITKTTVGALCYLLSAIVLFYFNLRLFFVLPLTMTNDNSIFQNIKRSWYITKTCKKQLIGSILLFEIIFFVISTVTIIVLTIIFFALDTQGHNLILQTAFFTLVKIVIFSFTVLSKIAIITNLVMIIVDKDEISEGLKSEDAPKIKQGESKSKLAIFLVASFLLVAVIGNSLTVYTTEVNKNIEVVAHRGYVNKGVENSLEALEAAKEYGASSVEVDVLLTKDNKFVVMHDYNLKRLAKLNRKVQDMTYDEIIGLDIYQNEFSSKIPSFEQFVARAKELDIKLLVELKPHGKEPSNYAELFITKMKELGVADKYKTISLNLKIMEEINTLAPEMETGYIIPFQFGGFADNNVDFFVIEDFSYKQIYVTEALEKNKEVYVWTINDERSLKKYLQSNVTGIITDEVELAIASKEDLEKSSSYFERVINILLSA